MKYIPPATGNEFLDLFLLDLSRSVADLETGLQINNDGSVGNVYDSQTLTYVNRYLFIRFATTNTGTGFGTTDTGAKFIGFYNKTTSSTSGSTSWFNYTWIPVSSSDPDAEIASDENLYYKVTGGRKITYYIGDSAPDAGFVVWGSGVIDLDYITTTSTTDAALNGHLADTTDAHDASAISVTPVGGVAATDVQAAIQELDSEKSSTSHTHGQLHDAATVTDSTTIDFSITGQQISGSVITQMSISSDASGLKLNGDTASPGTSMIYGTHAGTGVRGWYALSNFWGGNTISEGNTEVSINDAGSGSINFTVDGASFATFTASSATFDKTVITIASASGAAGFRLPHGAAPSSPTNGDVWTTTSGIYVQVNGSTVGPLGTGGGGGALDDLSDVVITTPSTGEVLKYNGTNWVNDTDATGGGGWSSYDDLEVAEYNAGSSGASITIDFDNNKDQRVTLSADTTITLSNPKEGVTMSLRIIQDAATARTVSFATTLKTPGGVDYVATTDLSAEDIISFQYRNGAWYAVFAMDFF
jgi:hypothetical protein